MGLYYVLYVTLPRVLETIIIHAGYGPFLDKHQLQPVNVVTAPVRAALEQRESSRQRVAEWLGRSGQPSENHGTFQQISTENLLIHDSWYFTWPCSFSPWNIWNHEAFGFFWDDGHWWPIRRSVSGSCQRDSHFFIRVLQNASISLGLHAEDETGWSFVFFFFFFRTFHESGMVYTYIHMYIYIYIHDIIHDVVLCDSFRFWDGSYQLESAAHVLWSHEMMECEQTPTLSREILLGPTKPVQFHFRLVFKCGRSSPKSGGFPKKR